MSAVNELMKVRVKIKVQPIHINSMQHNGVQITSLIKMAQNRDCFLIYVLFVLLEFGIKSLNHYGGPSNHGAQVKNGHVHIYTEFGGGVL